MVKLNDRELLDIWARLYREAEITPESEHAAVCFPFTRGVHVCSGIRALAAAAGKEPEAVQPYKGIGSRDVYYQFEYNGVLFFEPADGEADA